MKLIYKLQPLEVITAKRLIAALIGPNIVDFP